MEKHSFEHVGKIFNLSRLQGESSAGWCEAPCKQVTGDFLIALHLRLFVFICVFFFFLFRPEAQADELTGDGPKTYNGDVRVTEHEARLSIPAHLTRDKAIRQIPHINPGEFFVPPYIGDIPDSKYGEMVEWGRQIFSNTQVHASRYVGNKLNCSNCHLQEGRKPFAAPLWGAYPNYPQFRNKTRDVVTFEERVQDCFRYSMNGIAPTIDAPEMKAIVSYAHWLSKGAPINTELPGRGFARLSKPRDPNSISGEELYLEKCALCHGEDLLGKKFENRDGYMFPPLRGSDTFNRGAGMATVKGCAQFSKANMPLGKGWTLTDMEAWDICTYIWIQDRPFDPRYGWFRNIFTAPSGGN